MSDLCVEIVGVYLVIVLVGVVLFDVFSKVDIVLCILVMNVGIFLVDVWVFGLLS